MHRDCVVLFTHVWFPELERHVERLKRETDGVIDVFVVLHLEPGSTAPDGMTPDFTVARDDLRESMPYRHRQFAARGDDAPWGYVDMLWLSAFLDDRLRIYDRFWLLEYDVDLEGDWGRFFAAASTYDGDVMATRLRRLSQDIHWHFAKDLIFPNGIADPLIGLFCLSRLSRPLVEAYIAAMSREDWDGHFEALIPTFAECSGFVVREISGEGPWTPPERTDLHYTGRFDAKYDFETTWSFRPPHAFSYFADRTTRRVSPRDTLYHPVKIGVSIGYRIYCIKEHWRGRLKAQLGRLSRHFGGAT